MTKKSEINSILNHLEKCLDEAQDQAIDLDEKPSISYEQDQIDMKLSMYLQGQKNAFTSIIQYINFNMGL